MKRVALCLTVLLLVLASASYANATWCDSGFANKKAIQLPNLDLNRGTTIQVNNIDFSAVTVMADLNDVRVFDENSDCGELDRLCDGTSASTDGNCYFRLPNSVTAGDAARLSTYQLYYNYASAGNPPDDNAARATVCGFEDGEGCFFGFTDTGSINSDWNKFGDKSYEIEASEGLFNYFGSAEDRPDINYSTWVLDLTGESTGAVLQLLRSDEGGVCCITALNGDIVRNCAGTVVLYDHAPATWYQAQISYSDSNNVCFYSLYNEEGSLLSTQSGAAGVVADINLVKSTVNAGEGNIYFDNRFLSYPTLSPNLGAEESNLSLNLDVNAWRVETVDPSQDEFPVFSYKSDGNLTMDFNVFNSDNNRMLLDINYSSSSAQGTGTPIVDDLNLSAAVCATQDWTEGVSCSWDWNILLIADGNYFILFDVNGGSTGVVHQTVFEAFSKSFQIVSHRMIVEFRDENTFTQLVGLSVDVEGTSYTSDGSGQVTVPLPSVSDVFTVRAWDDNNYGTRYWEFDVNAFDDIDVNVLMLRDINGFDVDFKFYQTDQSTILANTRLWVFDEDNNLVSIRTTASDGAVDFFLEADSNTADGNYYFVTADGTRYYKIAVAFKRPLNEENLDVVSPYDLDLGGLASKTFNAQTTDITVYLFPNTVAKYQFDVNGGVSYFPRKLEVNYKGNPATATVQMYLPKVVDGLLTVFYTRNASDLTVLPNIFIRVFKAIVGAGTVEVQSVKTDAAGTATMSFVLDDEYRFDFYDSAGDFLFSDNIRPNFSSYYIYIDTGEITWDEPSIEYINISGLPTVGYVAFSDQGYDVNVTIDVNSGTILNSWLSIVNDDGNVTFNNACGSGCGYTIEVKDMNNTRDVKVIVFVETTSGLRLSRTWTFLPSDASSSNWIAILQGPDFRQEWGCSTDPNEPCFFLLMVSAFFIIGMVVAAGAGLTADRSAIGIVALFGAAIFTYFTWIPVGIFIVACLAVFGGLVLARRVF